MAELDDLGTKLLALAAGWLGLSCASIFKAVNLKREDKASSMTMEYLCIFRFSPFSIPLQKLNFECSQDFYYDRTWRGKLLLMVFQYDLFLIMLNITISVRFSTSRKSTTKYFIPESTFKLSILCLLEDEANDIANH
ncbi:Microtubule integrity protein mal3 [Frankliniella fusca]|uniref:Microtubule integrity protein mal3 n=1 Tax=Frankliniella fusca TaxID=407009 RepID=A0AAE1H274_9NEOP|nr:Microtubule integrity protein mal3 [Frankliniella fusca]